MAFLIFWIECSDGNTLVLLIFFILMFVRVPYAYGVETGNPTENDGIYLDN